MGKRTWMAIGLMGGLAVSTFLAVNLNWQQGTPGGPVTVQPAASAISSFGAWQMAEEHVDQALAFPYGINTEFVTSTLDAGATLTHSAPFAVLTTGINDAGYAAFETKAGSRYVPGQGIEARFTAVFTACTADSRQVVGFMDAVDGFGFGCNGATFGVVRRSGGTDNWVAQTDWNADTFNGSGPSGVTLDPTKGYPYAIKVQWLGFGAISFFIENPNTGAFTLVHQIKYAGTSTSTSVLNPTLPIRAEAINLGSETSKVLKIPSLGVIRHGEEPTFGLNFSTAHSKAISTAAGGVPVLAIRNETSFGGIQNRVRAKLAIMAESMSAAADATIRVTLNPTTVTGGSWADISTSKSTFSVNTGLTAISGGRDVFSTVLDGPSSTVQSLAILEKLNPGDIIAVSGQSSAATPTLRISLVWTELP